MEVRRIDLPRTIVMGNDIFGVTPKVVTELDLEGPVTVLADKITWKLAGNSVVDHLDDAGFTTIRHTVGSASLEEVGIAEGIVKESKSDVVLGVGGGTVIDVAKLSSFNNGISFFSVPTAASHDGIASGRASVSSENARVSIAALPPIAVLADIEIIEGAPRRFLSAGCGDIISKRTALKDWELAHRLKNEPISEHAMALAAITAERIIAKRETIGRREKGSVETVLKALITSSMAMCIAGSSRPGSGSEHLFSHALDSIASYPALHGEQVGVGTILMSYLHGLDWREVRETLSIVGAPTTAMQLGITEEQLIEALTKAHTMRLERYTILGSDGMTEEAARQAAVATGVIEE